jgi:hypothetical protein
MNRRTASFLLGLFLKGASQLKETLNIYEVFLHFLKVILEKFIKCGEEI